ncbi:MAG TPA: ABC transporter substrate-binding protein, partial [Polyangiaceae bacterium]|nr:ABC transporter substrate-binding protein [Polyangiaceae bacterium]
TTYCWLSILTLGCGGVESLGTRPAVSCDLVDYELDDTERSVSIGTFWTDTAEASALRLLEEAAERSRFVVTPTRRRDRLTQQLSLRDWLLNDSEPLPDLFQVNGGSDVLQWPSRAANEEPQLCSLDRLDQLHAWRDQFFPATLAPLSCGDSLYALPIGVHRLNTLIYNPALLTRLATLASEQGLELRLPDDFSSPADFLAALQTIEKVGQNSPDDAVVPLAIGNQSGWPLTVLGFENLLVGRGVSTYESLWGTSTKEATLQPEALRHELEGWLGELRVLVTLSNLKERMAWQDAVHLVASGGAAFTVMGDWAVAQLSAHEVDQIELRTFPGTEEAFVYTPDSFAVSRLTDSDGAGANYWLREVVANRDVQLAFSARKYSIPALRDLEPTELERLDARQRETYRTFSACQTSPADCRLLLAVSGLGPAPGTNPCFDEIDRLLTRAVGASSAEDDAPGDEGSESVCPLQEEPEAAGQQLIDILVAVAREPFAADCR